MVCWSRGARCRVRGPPIPRHATTAYNLELTSLRAFISQWSPLGALPPTARERVGEASEVASPARDPQAAAIVSGNVCGNYVDSRSYYRTRTRPLEAPPGLSRARQSGVVHRKTTHKTTRDPVSGPGGA